MRKNVSPPSKGGETYLLMNLLIIIVFAKKIFLKLMAISNRGM
jgi:hypothetical protein